MTNNPNAASWTTSCAPANLVPQRLFGKLDSLPGLAGKHGAAQNFVMVFIGSDLLPFRHPPSDKETPLAYNTKKQQAQPNGVLFWLCFFQSVAQVCVTLSSLLRFMSPPIDLLFVFIQHLFWFMVLVCLCHSCSSRFALSLAAVWVCVCVCVFPLVNILFIFLAELPV